MDGETMEVVEEYKYLGTIFTSNGKINQEIQNRIQQASTVYHAINKTIISKPEIQDKTKLQIYNSIYIPTLTYGAESWPLTTKNQSKITAAEMKFLRRIKNKTKRDRIRNTQIREELKQGPLLQRIHKKQLQWYGHITRMDKSRIPKQVHEAREWGQRTRGRPRQSWMNNINNFAQKKGKSLAEITRIAQNREAFKKLIHLDGHSTPLA